MQNSFFRCGLIILVLGALSGCAPQQMWKLGDNKQVLVLDASKRSIFVFDDKTKAFVCPEPSPDVMLALESQFKAALDASGQVTESNKAAAKAELEEIRKEIATALTERSQGLQVLRDMLFQACLANLRGGLDDQKYALFVTKVLPGMTTTLITSEILMKKGRPDISDDSLKNYLQYLIGIRALDELPGDKLPINPIPTAPSRQK